MTHTEYSREFIRIEKEALFIKSELRKKFALSNNPHKIGDVITDHLGSGKILSIHPHLGFMKDYPSCTYRCDNLTKKGTISKRESIRSIAQENIKS